MFVVLVNYTAPLETIDAHLPAHVAFLDEGYASGMFLASGRRNPRTGGIIMARKGSREALAAYLAKDPFAVNGLADYEILEFSPTKTAPELAGIREEIA